MIDVNALKTTLQIDLKFRISELSWSPDGKRILFESMDTHEIYVVDADGSNLTQLTDDPAYDFSPVWSPDGRQISFNSNRSGNFQIYLMEADGSNVICVTNDSFNSFFPTWSPDGSRIAFESDRDGNPEIYSMDIDGSHVTRLTNDPASDSLPMYSPDGKFILFRSFRNEPDFPGCAQGGNYDCNGDIYIIEVDNMEETHLTTDQGDDWSPRWSPDGKQVAFQNTSSMLSDAIYIVDRDGTNLTRLTNLADGIHSYSPAWSPDGKYITFNYYSQETGSQIVLMAADGSNFVVLTNDQSKSILSPLWQP